MADGTRVSVPVVESLRFDIDGRVVVDEALVMGREVLIGQTVPDQMRRRLHGVLQRLVLGPDYPYPEYRG
jgi:hypothetical protein